MFKITPGFFIKENGDVIDKRIGTVYKSEILTKFLHDVEQGELKNINSYIDSLDIDKMHKEVVGDCINYTKRKHIIEKKHVFFKKINMVKFKNINVNKVFF